MDFAFETTLTTISYTNTIKIAREKGYHITLIYFWLDNVNLAIERVKLRVSEGGHSIPEDVIKRRYHRGITNLIRKFINLCDFWTVINNSAKPFTFVAEGNDNGELKVYNNAVWETMKKTIG